MSPNRLSRVWVGVTGAALVASLGLTAPGAQATIEPHQADPAQVVLDWERTAFATVYPAKPIPVGVPILGFTSVAMHDAAQASLQRGRSSEIAAVATAAHDVLLSYFPAAATTLQTKLTSSLATVTDPKAKAKGIRIGTSAAARMLASRASDGFEDATIHYSKPSAAGIWQPVATVPPAPPADMLAAWLGSLDPLVLDSPVPVDGPDALNSADYTADYLEVLNTGRATGSSRTPTQTDTAYFFNANAATMVGDAMIRMLEAHPVDLRTTALFFARMHASMTDSVIRCWELKRDVGFWRPFQAIPGAGSDGNGATTADTTWTSLLANPNYSDYVSGHACLTSSAVETVRMMFGEGTDLELRWTGTIQAPSPTTRSYTDLTTIETDAFHSRIWGGLHFRDAMVDGYAIGHATAQRVAQLIR